MTVETQTKPRTRKAPAKKAEPEVINHDTGETNDERGRLAYTAVGRSGQVTTRTSTSPMTHGVDYKLPNAKKAEHRDGVVARMFTSEAKAQAFAERVNAGEHPTHGKDATDAIVVTVDEVR